MAVELLAPAGSTEALRAACIAGADAVYIGGNRFGARAYADNPETEELLEAIRLVHRLGKRLYLTVNTLLKDAELQELCSWIRPFYEESVDAIIVQDPGVVKLLRESFPDLPLHASTQMAVTGPDGVRLLQKMGIRRVVPARELSLRELRGIREETGIELETFIHGALCYSYSGHCLMSSMSGGRSGNRGRCAGICRLPYRPDNTAGRSSGEELYPLNMKDLCTLQLLPQLVEGGIYSFKIEGRMKKPTYTAGVVSVYRRALDALLSGSWKNYDDREDRALLAALYNRDGFTNGYYTRHNGAAMIALHNEKLQGKRAAAAQQATEEIRERLHAKEAEQRLQMPVEGTVRLRAGEPLFCRLTAKLKKESGTGESVISVSREAEVVERARTAPTTDAQIREQLQKTGGSPFRFESLQIDMDGDLFVPVRTLKELRRNAFQELEQAVQKAYSRKKVGSFPPKAAQEEKKKESVDRQQRNSGQTAPSTPLLYASVLTREQAEALLGRAAKLGLHALCLPPSLHALAEKARREGIRPILALPFVLRRETPAAGKRQKEHLTDGTWDGVLVRDLEEAGLYGRLRDGGCAVPAETILDATAYTTNEAAAAVYADWGFTVRTLPYELNFRELRGQNTVGSQLVVYGRTPVMISAQCPRKTLGNCMKRSGWTGLTDRTGRRFPVYADCADCLSVIYNSLPTSLLQEREAIRHLACGSLRMDFTDESPEEAVRIAAAVRAVFLNNEGNTVPSNAVLSDMSTTRGHFRRGVE